MTNKPQSENKTTTGKTMKIYWSKFEDKMFFENTNGTWDWWNDYWEHWSTLDKPISFICDAKLVCEVSDDQ